MKYECHTLTLRQFNLTLLVSMGIRSSFGSVYNGLNVFAGKSPQFCELAVALADGCGLSRRPAQRGCWRRILSALSGDAGHEDAADPGQCNQYGGAVAGAAYLDRRLSRGCTKEPGDGGADGCGRISRRHGRRVGSP